MEKKPPAIRNVSADADVSIHLSDAGEVSPVPLKLGTAVGLLFTNIGSNEPLPTLRFKTKPLRIDV